MIKKSLSLVVVSCLLLVLVVGCGGSTSTTTYYYYPNWTPDGKIICSINEQTSSSGSGVFGGSGGSVSNSYSFTIMDSDGSNESNIKGISNAARVAASPLGNYYAYAEIQQNYINIIDTSGNAINSIDCGASVDSLDWSPDESKLVFGIKTSATSEIYSVNRDGTGKTFLAVGENVAWRAGNRIFFEYISGIYTYLGSIVSDGSSFRNFGNNSLASPQILSSDSNICFGKASNSYRKIEISLTSEVNTILFSPFNGYLSRLSKTGTEILFGEYNASGIWKINVTGTGEAQIK